jgi:hypothetical protein
MEDRLVVETMIVSSRIVAKPRTPMQKVDAGGRYRIANRKSNRYGDQPRAERSPLRGKGSRGKRAAADVISVCLSSTRD